MKYSRYFDLDADICTEELMEYELRYSPWRLVRIGPILGNGQRRVLLGTDHEPSDLLGVLVHETANVVQAQPQGQSVAVGDSGVGRMADNYIRTVERQTAEVIRNYPRG